MRWLALALVVVAAAWPTVAAAVQQDALDPARDWQLKALRFRGNGAVSTDDLRQAMLTKARPWYARWRPYPDLDPVVLGTDLERLRRLYESRGYYQARILHDIELPRHGTRVVVVIYIEEGPPIRSAGVDVTFAGTEMPADERARLLAALPVAEGKVFTEEAYDKARAALRAWYREHGFALVEVEKRASIDVEAGTVAVGYRVTSGPETRFGDVRVEGTEQVDPEIARREVAFKPGEPFRQSKLDRTRVQLARLSLFQMIRLDEEPAADGRVDIVVRVRESPPREIRLGAGYDTEEQVRGLASWRSYNFLGGARQLGFSARISQIERAATADFLQPHFPGAANRSRFLLSQLRDEEDTYTLDRSRASPRLEFRTGERLTGYVFYRAEYDALSSVSQAVRLALPGAAPRDGILSGFGIGADWDETDDLTNPSRGWVTGATVEPVGGPFGGDFSFVRLGAEGRYYQPLGAGFLGAARVRVGTAQPLHSGEEIPLFERFYAGGINSVRGYGRRRIGPLVDDEPIGGRSLAEASVELRHPITETIGAHIFLDGGQVSLKSFRLPFDDLQYGAGLGVSYKSPVGPIRLDLGFPVEPPPGDAHWQIHVSVGATF